MYTSTPRTTATRLRERVSYDADLVHSILDEAWVCHLSFVVGSGDEAEPRVLPTLHVRIGEVLYVHGSTGSRPLRGAKPEGLKVSVAVTLLDGLVLARSQFHHSANYRSVVAHGIATVVTDPEEKSAVLTAIVEKIAAGRAADTRAPSPKELAQTSVLALPLSEVSAKVRAKGVGDEPEDYALPHWAGVVPLRTVAGEPEPDKGVEGVPDYLRAVIGVTA
jgi:nitroimidazol reductase NimA-like FMN-containing flavoprotein (pyridoxamine 5'-phosphate oxidase superfamily)